MAVKKISISLGEKQLRAAKKLAASNDESLSHLIGRALDALLQTVVDERERRKAALALYKRFGMSPEPTDADRRRLDQLLARPRKRRAKKQAKAA